MIYNKKVGDEIFDNMVTPHPHSFFAVFGKNVQDCSDEELTKIVSMSIQSKPYKPYVAEVNTNGRQFIKPTC